MRLINLNTHVIKEFMDHERPPYVILSHTWGAEEVSLQMLLAGGVEEMAGYRKIMDFCRQGAAQGFEWGWVDTCCIDKTSSAELSEAINSMYKWYQEADVCYVFLPDVQYYEAEPHLTDKEFAKSRWFTRGWTLQELLAPSSVVFYLANWIEYGSKASMMENMSNITGVPREALSQHRPNNKFSIAHRMSWVASRQTTRIEDMSYCLLGIFEVNMPLLYGEGEKAFRRLQEEIMKISVDLSILAWPHQAIPYLPYLHRNPWISCLAPSPAVFKDCKWNSSSVNRNCGPYSLTNKGLRIENLPIVDERAAEVILASVEYHTEVPRILSKVIALLCASDGHNYKKCIFGLVLFRDGGGYYHRLNETEYILELDSSTVEGSTLQTCLIGTEDSSSDDGGDVSLPEIGYLRILPAALNGFTLFDAYSPIGFIGGDDGDIGFCVDNESETVTASAGFFFSKTGTIGTFAVIIGAARQEWLDIIVDCDVTDLEDLVDKSDKIVNRSVRILEPVDRMSKILEGGIGGKEVFASVSRGMKSGERVFFLDVAVREARRPV